MLKCRFIYFIKIVYTKLRVCLRLSDKRLPINKTKLRFKVQGLKTGWVIVGHPYQQAVDS